MGADDGGIDDQVFKVWIICQRFEHAQPDPFDAPPAEAPKHSETEVWTTQN